MRGGREAVERYWKVERDSGEEQDGRKREKTGKD